MKSSTASADSFRKVAPAVSPVAALDMPDVRMRVLEPSGIHMHIYTGCDTPVCYLSVLVEGGQAEAGMPAVAALCGIMHSEGSSKYSGGDISSTLDYNGAWIKSVSNSHHMQHSLFSLNSKLDKVLPVFADMVFNPTFPSKEFDVRREALARNIEVSQNDVSYVARCASDAMIMGSSHPLAIMDNPEVLRSLTRADVFGFHGRGGAVQVFLCGQVTPQIEELVAETFSRVSTGSAALDIRPFEPEMVQQKIIRQEDATQSAVMIALPAIKRDHSHYLPLHLTVMALGGYFGSRLMLNIRESKGLTYGISASLLGNIDDASILISAETDNANVRRLIDEVASEMQRLASDPCRGEEMWRLRQSASSAQASVLDSPFSIMDHHITSVLSGLPRGYFDAKQQCIASLTPDVIAEMAGQYLRPELMRIAVAGDIASL